MPTLHKSMDKSETQSIRLARRAIFSELAAEFKADVHHSRYAPGVSKEAHELAYYGTTQIIPPKARGRGHGRGSGGRGSAS